MTEDTETGSFISKICDCGQVLYFTNEAGKAFYEKLLDGNLPEGGRGVFILGPNYINCPTCGKIHILPAPEMLDDERSPLWKIMHPWKNDEQSNSKDTNT